MRSDTSLARAAAAGDREAFDRLYRLYRPGLIGFVFRQVGDRHTAEDVVQETFLVAWRDLAKLRDPDVFRTWLFSIAYRRAMSAAARVAPAPLPDPALLVDDTPGRHPEQAAEQREAYELVWAAAHGLEPRQRAVLELNVRWDLSSREIGEVLGVGTAHAAVLVHRSRTALGSAVRTVLIARRHGRCAGLDAIVHGRRRLTSRERSQVDRHVRGCDQCRRLSARNGAYAVFAALLALTDGPVPGSSVQTSPAAAVAAAGARGLRLPGKLALGSAATVLAATGVWALVPVVGEGPDVDRAGAAAAAAAAGIAPGSSASPSASGSASPSAAPVSPSVSPSAVASVRPSPTKAAPATLEAQMLALVNQARKSAGCGALRAEPKLDKASRLHSADMAKRNYFSHTTPDGVSPWDRAKAAGYTQPSAENIAAGNATAKATMNQWMNSPGHKANILNCSYKAMGVGRATGGSYRYYWTQMFGFR
ncbi:sigma-70 family RNA polymerase sigma factor [Catellatospora sichuanensis]|uniref:sigma-70 family RNA polymerase sigma factor n=1 Tax=Catellatospora sichuanensis TaxID=1969805 RepID=UPI0011835EAB|nr:sigma-70 family RNA polymerase sigma factor [Catellatospora sichuanensis]